MLFLNAVGNGRDNDPDDVFNAKRALTSLGRHRLPRHGLNGIIDRPLDDAIKGFQKDNDLRVDGWMRPGGPTQRRLEQSLGARWQTVADRDDKPRLEVDLPGWTPRLVDPETGDDVLAPDGKPFVLTPSRTRELVEQARSLGRIDPRKANRSQLDELSAMREGLSALWGPGMPRLGRPDGRGGKPDLSSELEPGEIPKEEDGLLDSARRLARELWKDLDERMTDPGSAPSETPPIDPPSPPTPPFLPGFRHLPLQRRRFGTGRVRGF